ncbi:YpdA family putative bacillithiol disulfide reductase [Aciduricibacillus chroicocephali]|uniref:YpdA family putative bacillithiol disulfide reductase n=1 Tax=Aciduricibacillus chroicocephali TaxID=3054939 RepID=A0ABY9KRE9_9BACI|nr:YpdA family putative bacillithiol disulfide reductase [Bacillaceae bacterium 44XB]
MTELNKQRAIIIGAGPCGMSAAIELQNQGIDPLIIEKGNIAETIYRYPTHQTFFSSSEKLEIGNVAFITASQKPVRLDALAYYRSVAMRKELCVRNYEKVLTIQKNENLFEVLTDQRTYLTENCIVATGYYGQPNMLNIPGEDLPKVSHYFKEAHPYYQKDVVVIGGKNSAVDAAIELHKAGARVTVLYRGSEYSPSVKPWILPLLESLVEKGEVTFIFNAEPTSISDQELTFSVNGQTKTITNDFVFAMTGYHPDYNLLKSAGVEIDKVTGSPVHSEETYETNVPGLYIAGVVAAGYNNNSIFIENGRFHGEKIAKHIARNLK